MFCEKCGAQIPDGVKFCGVCGLPVKEAQPVQPVQQQAMPEQPMQGQQMNMPYQQMQGQPAQQMGMSNQQMQYQPMQQMPTQKPPKQKKEKVKKEGGKKINASMIRAAVLAVALVLSLLGVIPSLNVLGGKSGRVEGKGFDTPEEAAEAYIKALNSGNMDELLSTYAIESYVDNFDTRAHIERFKCFQPAFPFNATYELSDGEDFDRDFRIKARQGLIMYRYYQMVGLYTTEHDSMVIALSDEKEIDSFMKKIQKSDFLNKWKDMEFVEFLDPDDITNNAYNRDQNVEYREKVQDIFGCEELTDVCALVEVDGDEYAQFLQCGMYDGKWYIIDCNGLLASMIGVTSDKNGLVPKDELP